MANATMSISTVAAGALFALGNLFVQQPYAAAVAYTLYAVAENGPRFLPTYNTTAEKVNSILSNLGPQQYISMAHDDFVDEAGIISVSETPRIPVIETSSTQAYTPDTTTSGRIYVYGGTPFMLKESSPTLSSVVDEIATDDDTNDENTAHKSTVERATTNEATTLIAGTKKSPEAETTSENFEYPASSEVTGTSLNSHISNQPSTTPSAVVDETRESPKAEEISEQPSKTPDIVDEEMTTVSQERSTPPVISSLPNELEMESKDETESMLVDELVNEPGISIDTSTASHSSTGSPVTPSSTRVVPQPTDSDDHSKVTGDVAAHIAFPSYAELLDSSRTLVRPFALFVVIPLILLGIYNRFIRNHEVRQDYFRFVVGTFYACVVAYLAFHIGPSGILAEMSQPVFTAIDISRFSIGYAPAFVRKCLGLEPTSFWHWGRNLISTVVALSFDYLHFLYVKLVNMTSFTPRHLPLALPAPRDMLPIGQRRSNWLLQVLWMSTAWIEPWHYTTSWFIVAITAIGYLVLFINARYPLDLLIPLVLQAPVAMFRWCYQNGAQAYRYFRIGTRPSRRFFRFLASSPRKICDFISRNKGWFILYAGIIYAICAPEALHLGKPWHAVLAWIICMAQQEMCTQRMVMVSDLALHIRSLLVGNPLTDLILGWYEMRHDAKAKAVYFGQYFYWVYSNPRDSWAAVKYYSTFGQFLYWVFANARDSWAAVKYHIGVLVSNISYAEMLVQALRSAGGSIITSLVDVVHQIQAVLREIVNFCKNLIGAAIFAIWTRAWSTSWCPLSISIVWNAFIVFLYAFVITVALLQFAFSDVVTSNAVRKRIVALHMFILLVFLLLRKDCLQEIFAGILGALLAPLVFWVSKAFFTAVGGEQDHDGEAGKDRRIGGYPSSNGSDAGSDDLENTVDSLKDPSPKDLDTSIADTEREKEIANLKLDMEKKRVAKENFEKEKLSLLKLVLGSTPDPTPKSASKPAPKRAREPASVPAQKLVPIVVGPLLEDVLEAELSTKQAQLDQNEQERRAKDEEQIHKVVAQSAKVNKGGELALTIDKLGGNHPIVGMDTVEVHTEGITNSLPIAHAPAPIILPYSTGFQAPDPDDSSGDSDKDNEKPDLKPDVNMPAKTPDSKPEDDEPVVPEPPSPVTAPEPEAQSPRVPPTPTTFPRGDSLNLDDFPMPALYNRPANRPATGVDSKEEWRNRILGGPSILTQMRREREAAANNRSNDLNGDDDDSSGAPPSCLPEESAGPSGDGTGGDAEASPKPVADKQDEDRKPSADRKDDDDDDSSKPNDDGAPIAAVATMSTPKTVDDGLGDTEMDDAPENTEAPENNDIGSFGSADNLIMVGEEEDAMDIVVEDVSAELPGTVASGDLEMGGASWDGTHINTNVAQSQQAPVEQNISYDDPKLNELMKNLAALAADINAQKAQQDQAAQDAQATRPLEASSSTQPTMAQRDVAQVSSSQRPQQQTLSAFQTVSIPGMSTPPIPPPEQIPAAPFTQPLQQSSFLSPNTPTLPKSPIKPLVTPLPFHPIAPVAPVAPVAKIQEKLAPIFTNLKLPESSNTPSATKTVWNGNFGTANPFIFSTRKASSAQSTTPSQLMETSQPTLASPLTQANVASMSAPHATQMETKPDPGVQAKPDPVVEDGSGDQFSDISSLGAEELKDTSEAEKMLANAMPATTNNGAQNVTSTPVAAPPVAPQSPADSDQEFEDAMYAEIDASLEEVAEAERVEANVRNGLSEEFLNSDDDNLSDVPDNLSDHNAFENDESKFEKLTDESYDKENSDIHKPDPVKKADAKKMAGRKIMPLKKHGLKRKTPKTASGPSLPEVSASAEPTPKASASPNYLKGIKTPTVGIPKPFTPKYSSPLTPPPLGPSPSYETAARPYSTPNSLRKPAKLGIGFDAQSGPGTSPYKNPKDDPYLKRAPITYTPMAPGRTYAPVTVPHPFDVEDTSMQDPVPAKPTFPESEPDEKPLSPRPNGPDLGDFYADNDGNYYEIEKVAMSVSDSWQVGSIAENGLWMKYNTERKGWEDEFNGNIYHRVSELEYGNAYVPPSFGDEGTKRVRNPAESPTSPRSPVNSSESGTKEVEDPYRGEIWTYHDDVETEFVVAFGTNTSRFWFDDNGHIMY
jgi:hypothetical protein